MGSNLCVFCMVSTTPVGGSDCEHLKGWPHSCWGQCHTFTFDQWQQFGDLAKFLRSQIEERCQTVISYSATLFIEQMTQPKCEAGWSQVAHL